MSTQQLNNPQYWQKFVEALPHGRLLNLQVVEVAPSRAVMMLPVHPELICQETNGYTLGGVMTTLVDTGSALATLCAMGTLEIAPTLDLRIDHMASPVLDKPLYVAAECYRKTKDVLFTRATIYQDSPDEPIAYAIATFMRLGKDAGASLAEEKA
jgi:acyl-coenzyme A thioesterase PaaI-like protein